MEEKIKALIARLFNAKTEELTADTLLKENLGASSLNLPEISATMENEFGIDIPKDRVAWLKSVGDIIAFQLNSAESIVYSSMATATA